MSTAPALPAMTPPITLEGSVVRLEPLQQAHTQAFWEVAQASLEETFRWIPYRMQTPEDFDRLWRKPLPSKRAANRLYLPQSSVLPAEPSAALGS